MEKIYPRFRRLHAWFLHTFSSATRQIEPDPKFSGLIPFADKDFEIVNFLLEDGRKLRSDSSQIVGIGRSGFVAREGTAAQKRPKTCEIPKDSSREVRILVEAENERNRQLVLAEGDVYRRLIRHPNLLAIDNYQPLQFELIEGVTLDRFIRTQPEITKSQKERIIATIADTLRYIHKCHVAHNDFTLGNIMISKSNDVKVIDFGYATLFSEECDITAEEEIQVDRCCFGHLAYSIVTWKVYDANDLNEWSFPEFLRFRESLPDLEICLFGQIISDCLTNRYPNMDLVCKKIASRQ